jgi:hypothetical protein
MAMISKKGKEFTRAVPKELPGEASCATVFPTEPVTSKKVMPKEYPSMDQL